MAASRCSALLFAVALLLCAVCGATAAAAAAAPSVSSASSFAAALPPRAGDSTPPVNVSQWVGHVVMMISAHPDDIEAMAGGLVRQLTAQGTRVVYVIVTNGDKGCTSSQYYNCSNMTSVDIAAVREREARAAAALLGVTDVVLLDYEDAMVTSYPEASIREDLAANVRRYRADVVFTWHPEWQLDLQPGSGWDDLGFHPDHQAVGAIAIATTLGPSAGDRFVFPALLAAGLQPYGVSQIYTWTLQGYSHYFNITSPTLLDAKIDALCAHRSQYPDPAQVRAGVEDIDGRIARMAFLPADVAYAETFDQICIFPDCAINSGKARAKLF